jgi:hypothetical protein
MDFVVAFSYVHIRYFNLWLYSPIPSSSGLHHSASSSLIIPFHFYMVFVLFSPRLQMCFHPCFFLADTKTLALIASLCIYSYCQAVSPPGQQKYYFFTFSYRLRTGEGFLLLLVFGCLNNLFLFLIKYCFHSGLCIWTLPVESCFLIGY